MVMFVSLVLVMVVSWVLYVCNVGNGNVGNGNIGIVDIILVPLIL